MLKKVQNTPRKILLVDHKDPTREIFRSVLEGAGYQVTTAKSREDALKKIDKKLPDVIISEAELPPEKSGLHFYKHLKTEQKTAAIPFIFLTAVEQKVIAKLLKANDLHIVKPVKSQDFLTKVDEFVAKRFPKTASLKKTKKIKVKQEKSVIKLLDFNIDKEPKPKRAKNVHHPIMPLPPGHSTKFFEAPSGVFDIKVLKTVMSKAVKNFKAGIKTPIEEMMFPPVSETSPRTRLVPVNIPKPDYSIAEDAMVVDLTDEMVLTEENYIYDEFDHDMSDEPSSAVGGLRDVFLQHIAKRASDFQMGIFDNLVVIDDKSLLLYSDELFRSVDLGSLYQKWQDFLHNLRSLSISSEVTGNTHYVWVESQEDNFLLVNSPQKEILAFANASEAPIEAIFDEKEISMEDLPEDKTFFLLPNLSCKEPLVTPTKMSGLITKLVSDFLVQAETSAVIQDAQNGSVVATTKQQENYDQIHECAHNILSVAGLCSQICEMGFHVDYVMVECEDQNSLFINDANKGLFVSCLEVHYDDPSQG